MRRYVKATLGTRHAVSCDSICRFRLSSVTMPRRGTKSLPTTTEQTNCRMYADSERLQHTHNTATQGGPIKHTHQHSVGQ